MMRLLFLSALSFMIFGCSDQMSDSASNNKISLTKLDRSESVQGVDRNKDGVRDDIETIIKETYEEPLTRELVYDLARNLQKNLTIDHNNKEQVLRAYSATEKSITCLDTHATKHNIESRKVIEELSLLTSNTGVRFFNTLQFEDAVERIGRVSVSMPAGCG